MAQPNATTGNTDFDNTELGRAFIEMDEIRKEIGQILGERRQLLADPEPVPLKDVSTVVNLFAGQRTAAFKAMPL